MQISSVNLFNAQNSDLKLNKKNNYFSAPKMEADSFSKVQKTNLAPIFKQSANSISLVSFGGLAQTSEMIKPALQMRVQGVKNLQHNMDPEKMKEAMSFSINRLAEGPWQDGQKLLYSVEKKAIKLFSKEVGEIGRVPDVIAPFLVGALLNEPKDYEFELSNVIAGNTKGASTIGLRVNLLYKGDDPESAFDMFNSVLEDTEASKKAFFYQPASSPRDVLKQILKIEEQDNGIEAAKTMERAVEAITKELDAPENKNILLIGHCKPDGDTLGCIMGLKNSIDMVHPEKHVDCAVDDEVTGLFRHKLPGLDDEIKHPYSQQKIDLLKAELVKAEKEGASDAVKNSLKLSLEKAQNPDLLLDKNKKYDVVVLMDIPTPTRFSAGFKDYIKDAKKAIYVDHHPYKEEEWENAKNTTGVDMKGIFNNGLAWVAERVPAACEQAAIIASKLSPKTNLLNPDNTITAMNSKKIDNKKLNATVAAFVTGIWTDTGGFGRTANLVPEDIIDKDGNKVPVQNRPNFLPEGLSKWLMGLTGGEIDKKWMRDNITYDINDDKAKGSLEPTAREEMLKVAKEHMQENKNLGLGFVNATYDEMNHILEMAQEHEPETGLLDVQNAFKYSEVMGNFRSSELQNGISEEEDHSEPGKYDEDKIAVFICENERKGDLNTEGKIASTDALRYSFRSVEGTTHAELLASLFNGGGHGGAAGGQVRGDGVRIDTPFAVKINGDFTQDSEQIYETLKNNYDIMHDSKLSTAEKALKRTNIELVPNENGETSASLIERIVSEIRTHEKTIKS